MEPQTEQWESGKRRRLGIRRSGQGTMGRVKRKKIKKERKNIIVAGIKEKPVENVLLSILRISGP